MTDMENKKSNLNLDHIISNNKNSILMKFLDSFFKEMTLFRIKDFNKDHSFNTNSIISQIKDFREEIKEIINNNLVYFILYLFL